MKTLETPPPDLSQLGRREAEPESYEVRGRPGIHVLISVVAGVTALAYLWRAVDGGSPILWLMVALLVGIAVLHLLGRREAALPRLVADDHGVRVRQRANWTGLPWTDLERVEIIEMHGPFGSTVVRLIDLDGESISVRCGASTRVSADDIVLALRALADHRTTICRGVAPSESSLPSDDAEDGEPEPEPAAPVAAADDAGSGRAVRAQVTRTEPSAASLIPSQPEGSEATASAKPAEPDAAAPKPEPAEQAPMIRAEVDVSIGPLLSAARFRQRLSVDELGDRTRIRPHVIEAIENEDFGPCGGDFYARGHLRSLCRVLGVDSGPVLEAFDRRYANAPIEARHVFEAELATGPRPTFRAIGRAANWIGLLVVVMLLAIVWAVAKVVTDGDDTGSGSQEQSELSDATAPRGDDDRLADLGAPVVNELVLRSVGGGARVTVRDSGRDLIWKGRLGPGDARDVSVTGPAVVRASNGGAVRMRFNDDAMGRLGPRGEPARIIVGRR
jgi:cytoskeleton protein RodZ